VEVNGNANTLSYNGTATIEPLSFLGTFLALAKRACIKDENSAPDSFCAPRKDASPDRTLIIGKTSFLQVTLKGAKDCVDGARRRILEIVNDLENQVTIECIIDQVHHRTIMGTRGSKVQKICSDFDVQIKIPGDGCRNTIFFV